MTGATCATCSVFLCDKPATARLDLACVHEHSILLDVCASCLDEVWSRFHIRPGCGQCFYAPSPLGHRCPLTVTATVRS